MPFQKVPERENTSQTCKSQEGARAVAGVAAGLLKEQPDLGIAKPGNANHSNDGVSPEEANMNSALVSYIIRI